MQPHSLTDDNNIKKNLADVEKLINSSCENAHRRREEITLIAVSKGHDFNKILAAYRCGQRDFGESYAQEFSEKIARARDENLADIRWHFIGAIQSNKLKYIKDADVIHSIGSLKHAELLNAMLSKPKNIFLQINLDNNPDRQGFAKEDVIDVLFHMKNLANLRVQGLMTILPVDHNKPATWFSQMTALKEEIKSKGILVEVSLSMGMSDDFLEAIANGANLLRIGTRIFGPRN